MATKAKKPVQGKTAKATPKKTTNAKNSKPVPKKKTAKKASLATKTNMTFLGTSKLSNGRWRSRVQCNGTTHYSGTYRLACDAAWAYDKKARELKGEDCKVNFASEAEYKKAKMKELEGGDFPAKGRDGRKYIGTSFHKIRGTFQSVIGNNGKPKTIGYFPLECDAAWAYDEKAKELKGEDCKLNFESKEEYEAARSEEIENMTPSQSRLLQISLRRIAKKYVGTYYDKGKKVYASQISHNGIMKKVGSYTLECDAAWAFDQKARELRGKDCKVNFVTKEDYEMEKMRELERRNDIHAESRKSVLDNLGTKGRSGKKYVGTCYDKGRRNFRSEIKHNGIVEFLGRYTFECDAAWAYDQKARELRGKDCKVNFVTKEDYEMEKMRELQRRNDFNGISETSGSNCNLMTSSTCARKETEERKTTEEKSFEVGAVHHTEGKYADTELIDEEETDDQAGFNVGVDAECETSFPPLQSLPLLGTSNDVSRRFEEGISDAGIISENATANPATSHAENRKSIPDNLEHNTLQNCGIQSPPTSETIGPKSNEGDAAADQSFVLGDNLSNNQNQDLPFPVGCLVSHQTDDSESQEFSDGQVISISFDPTSKERFYEIGPYEIPNFDTKEFGEILATSNSSVLVPENLLAYAPHCPVFVNSNDNGNTKEQLVVGEILHAQHKQRGDELSYTIRVRGRGKFSCYKVMENVPACSVQYREVGQQLQAAEKRCLNYSAESEKSKEDKSEVSSSEKNSSDCDSDEPIIKDNVGPILQRTSCEERVEKRKHSSSNAESNDEPFLKKVCGKSGSHKGNSRSAENEVDQSIKSAGQSCAVM